MSIEELPGLAELDKRQSIHEAVCAERYATVLMRLGRLELIVLTANGGLIAALATIAFYLFKSGGGQ